MKNLMIVATFVLVGMTAARGIAWSKGTVSNYVYDKEIDIPYTSVDPKSSWGDGKDGASPLYDYSRKYHIKYTRVPGPMFGTYVTEMDTLSSTEYRHGRR
jgi:hypothetical protein